MKDAWGSCIEAGKRQDLELGLRLLDTGPG